MKERMGSTQGYTFGQPAGITANDDEDMPATVAHEIAHPFGVGDEYEGGSYHCAVNPAPPSYKGKDWNNRESTDFSCKDSTERPWNEQGRPGSGTLVPAQDVRPFDVGGRGLLGDAVSFMGSGAPQANNWITPRIYDRLFDQLAPAAPTPTASGTVLELAGHVSRAGGGETVEVAPWHSYEGTLPPEASGSATYNVRAVDGLGIQVAVQNLTVSFSPDTDPPRSFNEAPFSGAIALPPGTAKVQIRKGTQVLKEVPVSTHKPTVAILQPAVGATLAGETTITWTGADLDGDALTYDVEYSADNGATWEVLATGLHGTSYTEDFSDLGGALQGRIRVIASDGVHSTAALSGAVTVPPKAPEVYIDDPIDGAIYPQGAAVTLEGGAFDVQDDEITASDRLRWTSSRDGEVGGGGLLSVRSLRPGEHMLTLTAINTRGLSSSQTVRLTVTSAHTPGPDPSGADMAGGPTRPEEPKAGCGCHVGGAPASPAAPGILLGLGLVVGIGRRRRRAR